MTTKEYEELYCVYCDSQRCTNHSGNTVEERCPYWNKRHTINGKGDKE